MFSLRVGEGDKNLGSAVLVAFKVENFFHDDDSVLASSLEKEKGTQHF